MKDKSRALVERLVSSLGMENFAELARWLGVDPSVINRAIRTGKVPESWIYKVAYQTGRRLEWVETGKGVELHGNEPPGGELADTGHAKKLVSVLKDFNEEELETLQNLAELLIGSERPVRRNIFAQLKTMQETVKVCSRRR